MAEDRLHEFLSRAAIRTRPYVVFIVLFCIVASVMLIDSTRLFNGLTAFEGALAVGGVWLTLEIFRIGLRLSEQQSDVLKEQERLVGEVHRTVLVNLKISQSQEQYRKYQDGLREKDVFKTSYWHFVWRFETWTTMTLQLLNAESEDIGFARIRVIGTSIPALETDLEKIRNPIYTVEIEELKVGTAGEQLNQGRAYCTCINGSLVISNQANEFELYNPTFLFRVSGRIGESGAVGHRPWNYVRLKDITDISGADHDQG